MKDFQSYQQKSLKNIHKVLRPGGTLLFRDYGIYDAAMLRFKPGHKLMENFYVRQDGTRAYYFSKEMVNRVFSESGYLLLKQIITFIDVLLILKKCRRRLADYVLSLVFSSQKIYFEALRIFCNSRTMFRFSDEVQILSLDSSFQAISKFSDYFQALKLLFIQVLRLCSSSKHSNFEINFESIFVFLTYLGYVY
ncbi:Methyltransferase-like protein 6 [Chamberlinius hualienensis]